MRVWYFTEQPYYPAWESKSENLKLTMPNKYAEPEIVADLYDRYIDEWQQCDELGINVMVNEHHSTATSLSSTCTLTLSALARLTKKVRLMSLGIQIANRPDPVRVAEEVAMIDCLSRGRYEMGFVKGIDYDIFPTNSNPVTQLKRFDEAYRLIIKALTHHEGPFSWNGKYFQSRLVNIWPSAYQRPHPPVWMVAIGAGAGGWIAEQKANVGTFLNGPAAKNLFDAYRKHWESRGWGTPPDDKFGYMAIVAVSKDSKEAKRYAHQIAGYLRTQNRYESQFQNPTGYIPAEFMAKKMRYESEKGERYQRYLDRKDGTKVRMSEASVEDLIDSQIAFAGNPDEVFAQIKKFYRDVGGFGNLILMAQGGDLSHDDTMKSLRTFSEEVMPRLNEMGIQ